MTQSDITPAQTSTTTVDAWWDEVEGDEVEGHDLVKDEALRALVGVPFMITGLTFHDGIQRKGAPYRDDFVSIELRVAPSKFIAARMSAGRLSAEAVSKIQPGEMLVINDGSTGIYRQVLQYLAAKELIELPEGDEEGEKGECVYDLPRSGWASGADEATKGLAVNLRCPRGLRLSEYENEYTGGEKAKTWYLA